MNDDTTTHTHMPAAEVAVGYPDGSWWTASEDATAPVPCAWPGCTARLAWQRHADRGQYGWRPVPAGTVDLAPGQDHGADAAPDGGAL